MLPDGRCVGCCGRCWRVVVDLGLRGWFGAVVFGFIDVCHWVGGILDVLEKSVLTCFEGWDYKPLTNEGGGAAGDDVLRSGLILLNWRLLVWCRVGSRRRIC